MEFCKDGTLNLAFSSCPITCNPMAAGLCKWPDTNVLLGFVSPSRETWVSSECSGYWEELGPEETSETLQGELSEVPCPTP